MTYLAIVFAGIAAFFAGVTAGLLLKKEDKNEKRKSNKGGLSELEQHYRNFLNYDGTQQN